MKRTLCVLCLISLLASLTACGEGGDTVDTTTGGSDAVTTIDPNGCQLPEKDWGGREFRVLAKEHSNAAFKTFEVDVEEENGEVLNDTIFQRNRTIEERYNVKIVQDMVIQEAAEDNGVRLRQTVLAGESTYDLSMNWLVNIGTLASEGLFLDLYSVDYVDFDKEWWNAEANSALTLGGKLYFTTSDFLLHDKYRSYIVIYNADLATDYGMGNITDYVREGTWTIDKMDELGRIVANDVNQDGTMNDQDMFSVNLGAWKDRAMFAASLGNTIITNDGKGNLELTMNTERMVNSIEKIENLMDKSVSYIPGDTSSGSMDRYAYAATLFTNGNTLFKTSILNSVQSMSSKADFAYKVIPMPKYDEQQEKYLTQPDDITLMFGIPTTASDPDFCGFMLEALSYESSFTTLPTYYETCCKTKYAYDEESAEMIDLAMDGVIYDIGFIFNLGGLRDILLTVGRGINFASMYAGKEESAITAINELLAKFEQE